MAIAWSWGHSMAQQHEDVDLANRILLALPRATLQRLSPHLEPVALQQGHVIYHPDSRIEKVYFVNRGLVSLVRTMRDGRTVEIGTVGIEGVTGLAALFGIDNSTLECIVQIPGTALCCSPDILRTEMGRGRNLQLASSPLLPFGCQPDRADGCLQPIALVGRALLPLASDSP